MALRLNEAEEAPALDVAATLPLVGGKPNLSEALRRLIALGAAVHTGRGMIFSAAGIAKLDQLAQKGETREATAKRLLALAAQHLDAQKPKGLW